MSPEDAPVNSNINRDGTYGFSQAFYFKMRAQGNGPRLMEVGRRRLISREADEAWRREREEAAAKSEPANAA